MDVHITVRLELLAREQQISEKRKIEHAKTFIPVSENTFDEQTIFFKQYIVMP